jgi:hypothetical protein
MDIRQRCPNNYHDWVGRSDISASVRREHGKHVVAGRQVRRGELSRRCGDCPKFLRPVVKLQLFPIGESTAMGTFEPGSTAGVPGPHGPGELMVSGLL